MKDEAIAIIVDEVIRRIKLLIDTHRCLLLIRENTDYTLLNMLLLSMRNNGFVFDVLTFQDHSQQLELDESIQEITFISESDQLNKDDFIKQYEAVVISNLNIMEISKLTKLNIENHFMQLVYETLKEGISLYGFSKDLDIKNNFALKNLVLNQCCLLEDIGLKMILKNSDQAFRMDNQIITLDQIKDMNQKSLIINKSAIVTNSAKDYLTQNKIEIFRK